MIFDSLADVSCCPFCCNKSAIAPGPIALYMSNAQTIGLFHPDQRGVIVIASFHPADVPNEVVVTAVYKNHPPYITANNAVFVNY